MSKINYIRTGKNSCMSLESLKDMQRPYLVNIAGENRPLKITIQINNLDRTHRKALSDALDRVSLANRS